MRKGFTLVELLVVVSIIAILSVIGMVVYSDAQERAIEAKARADVDAFYKAYELKFDAATGTYPRSLTASDFVGGIPLQPNSSPYPDCNPSSPPCDLLGTGNYNKPFELCVKLSDATEYCKKSAQLSGSTLNRRCLLDSTGGTCASTVAGGTVSTPAVGTSPAPTSSPSPAASASPTASASPASTCQPNTSCTYKALAAALLKQAGETGFNPSCNLFQGEIIEIIDISDISCLTSSTTLYGGLQAYWDMEETSGDRLNYNINTTTLKLTVSGAGLGTGTGPSTVMGNAAGNFQSSNAYLTMADQLEVSIAGDKTFAVWVKYTDSRSGASPHVVFQKGPSGGIEYSLFIQGGSIDNIRFSIPFYSSGIVTSCNIDVSTSTGQFSPETWWLVIAWYQAATREIDIQARSSSTTLGPRSTTCANPAFDRGGGLDVGAINGGSMRLDGLVDGLGIWNRLLTDSEKTELFNAGNGKQL